ncbi:MAG: hypothetical protein ACKO7W_23680 [Elainella sp.]
MGRQTEGGESAGWRQGFLTVVEFWHRLCGSAGQLCFSSGRVWAER